MSALDDFKARLPKGVRDNIRTVVDVETKKYETASIGLNWALNGGIGQGRITLLYGDSGAGKSLLMLQSIAEWQKQGLICGYLDSEGTVTREFAARLGVDVDSLIYWNKKTFASATNEILPYLRAGIDILVVDTYSDLLPEQFMEKDGTVKEFDGNKQVGSHARNTTVMLNMMHTEIKPNTAIVMMSQTTTDLSGMHAVQVPHGGKKIFFKVSSAIHLTSSRFISQQILQTIDGNQTPVGREVTATVKKNKFGPEMRTAKWNMYYEGSSGKLGIDFDKELVDLACFYNVIDRGSTGWMKWRDINKQGAKNFLKEVTPEQIKEIKKELETAMYGVIHEDEQYGD